MKKNKTIIIAEIGVNHNGNINLAKKLVNVAKKSGADYVKFQSFKTENLVCKNTKAFNPLKKLEISEKSFKALSKSIMVECRLSLTCGKESAMAFSRSSDLFKLAKVTEK